MVVVNLYAFEKAAANPDARFAEIIENIDIGGPALIRSAAKNFEDVAVVTAPDEYGPLADELDPQPRPHQPRDPLAPRPEGLRHHRHLRHRHCQCSRAHGAFHARSASPLQRPLP
jgi:hypothetical protein